VFGIGRFDPWSFAASAAGALVLLVCGLMYFARADATAAEAR